MSYKGTYDKTIYHDPTSGYCIISIKTSDISVPEKANDFGEVLHRNIHEWFKTEENRNLWEELQKMMNIEKSTNTLTETADNPFAGRTVVVTGKLVYFTRETINAKIESFGAKAGDSVSKNTNYLICGEKAGSKLDKAKQLGIPVLTEQQFLEMAGDV